MAFSTKQKLFLSLCLAWSYHPIEWSNLYASPGSRIKWKENQAITWENFKGKIPEKSRLAAETNSGIHFSYTCEGDKMSYNVYAYFDQDLSWKRKDAKPGILNHERLHFDISELYARKLRKKLLNLKHPCLLPKTELQKIFNDVVSDHKLKQKKYDLETNHSLDSLKQKYWADWVEQELIVLKRYKN